MEGYFPVKMKRKDLDEVNDDFSDFSLSSPAKKIRRLDAELPPIIEEEELVNPVVFAKSAPYQDTFVEQQVRGRAVAIDGLPENGERAIILLDPMNNMPLLQSWSPFSISVNSDLLSGFKNPVIWSKRKNLLKPLERETENQKDNSVPNNGCLAVVQWVPKHSHHQTTPPMEVPETEVSETMDADDTEATTMDIEDDKYFQQIPRNEWGSGSGKEGPNQWQPHCMIPQPTHNFSTPVAWSG